MHESTKRTHLTFVFSAWSTHLHTQKSKFSVFFRCLWISFNLKLLRVYLYSLKYLYINNILYVWIQNLSWMRPHNHTGKEDRVTCSKGPSPDWSDSRGVWLCGLHHRRGPRWVFPYPNWGHVQLLWDSSVNLSCVNNFFFIWVHHTNYISHCEPLQWSSANMSSVWCLWLRSMINLTC